jgi:translation initiation factor 2B subunit (eIF-2B alpha/beta/delta family)
VKEGRPGNLGSRRIGRLLEEYKVSKVYVKDASIYVEMLRVGIWLLLSEELRSKIVYI